MIEVAGGFPAEMRDYARLEKADASGAFAFDRLAPGSYYVITKVQWGVAQRYGTSREGGDLVEKVTVRPGETSKIIMSK